MQGSDFERFKILEPLGYLIPWTLWQEGHAWGYQFEVCPMADGQVGPRPRNLKESLGVGSNFFGLDYVAVFSPASKVRYEFKSTRTDYLQ